MHTHILPPTHGALMLYGIDELLTYHYLVAELFMVLPLDAVDGDADSVRLPGAPPGTEEFFAWPKERQAELIFEELFVKRTPLSEACCGVVSVLQELGLGAMLRSLHREHPKVGGQVLTIGAGTDADTLVRLLRDAASAPAGAHLKAEGDGLSMEVWDEVETAPRTASAPWREGGVYLITGGAGKLGRHLASDIARHGHRRRIDVASFDAQKSQGASEQHPDGEHDRVDERPCSNFQEEGVQERNDERDTRTAGDDPLVLAHLLNESHDCFPRPRHCRNHGLGRTFHAV